jgi:hypothetical protein
MRRTPTEMPPPPAPRKQPVCNDEIIEETKERNHPDN